jgi:dTDP-4-amino-4,6-dideoxygalactose transaminase
VLARFHDVHWMEPARGRLDPGAGEVAEALDAGAKAVLLAPIAGDGMALPDAQKLCRARGVLLMVDARASVGTRILDGGPERYGDLVLLPPDGEPTPGACGGAILSGDGNGSDMDRPGALGIRHAIQALAQSVRDEPRLRRWFASTAPTVRRPERSGRPPRWAVAAAGARLLQARFRADQRARHAQVMRINFGNLPAVELIFDPSGFQSAGAALPLLAQGRDAIVAALAEQGVPTRGDLGGWLAPEGPRGPRATDVAERVLLVPLHPFYRPVDIEAIGERLRRATLRVNGTGWRDPTAEEDAQEGEDHSASSVS